MRHGFMKKLKKKHEFRTIRAEDWGGVSLSPTPFDTKNKIPNHLQVILLDSKDKS